MKILQISSKVPYPPTDGEAIATLNLSKSFRELGHEVTILAMNTQKNYFNPEDLPDEMKALFNWNMVNIPATTSVSGALWNLFSSKLPYNAECLISLNFRDKLIETLKKEKFDVVQLEGLYLCPYIADIRLHSKALISLRAHNIEHEIWKRKLTQASGLWKHYVSILSHRIKQFEHDYINQYDVLIPITARDGKVFNKMGNHRPIHVAQTGINTGSFHPDRSKEKYPSLFFLGALDWPPNLEGLEWFFEHCWENILTQYPDIQLTVAGRNASSSVVKKLKLPNIIYLGEVEDAYEFMNEHAVMIAPVFTGSGIRVKVVEGMAMGKSIVTTTTGTEGIPTTSGENIIIADSPEDFTTGVIQLITHQDIHLRIGENARKFIEERFDNRVIATNLIDFYKRNL